MKAKQTVYRGDPGPESPGLSEVHLVTVDGKKLAMRLKEVSHSPTGFAWGYDGSGPAQLAYAILRDFFGNKEIAREYYQSFKHEIIANLKQDFPWVLTGEQIMQTDVYKYILASQIMED